MTSLKPEFVMGDAGSEIKKVRRAGKLENYLVEYKNSDGKVETCVVMHLPEADAVFVLNRRAGGDPIVMPATTWFKKEFIGSINEGKSESI